MIEFVEKLGCDRTMSEFREVMSIAELEYV